MLQSYRGSNKVSLLLFLLFLFLQVVFQFKIQDVKPNLHIVPPLPSKYSVASLSLGDKEFYFRVSALKIQNAGDSFGRFTPLKNYDYKKLYDWFKLMDELNSQSRIIPSLASYYYSQSQNRQDARYMVKYLEEHADLDIDKNWWWLYQAIYISRVVLKDNDLALKLAYKLSKNNAKDAPLWTKQMPAFLHVKMGQECEAFFIIKQMLDDHESGKRILSDEEMSFMRHFIKDRLSDLKNKNFNPNRCKNGRK